MSLANKAISSFRQLNGVVVSAGLMAKTVKVRIGKQRFDPHIKKTWNFSKNILVHDPKSSVRLGDVVAVSPGWRVSKQVRHVVTHIIAPFGTPLEDRPPVPTEEERLAERAEKKARKDERRAARKDGATADAETAPVAAESAASEAAEIAGMDEVDTAPLARSN